MSNKNNAKLLDFNGTATEKKFNAEIAEAAQKYLKNEHNINITMSDAIPTIVYGYLYCAAQLLEKNKTPDEDLIINVMNFMEMGVTFRESDDGEKSGNFVPFITPGTIFKTVIKSDEMTEDEE